ncbi:MAG: hypothetical protein EAZ60_04075 [Oscillatoriales cyanobacterium]|nr:MAG: hypothetical protein EAZ60_04075 [Oscillatoriales cyanobacterium]
MYTYTAVQLQQKTFGQLKAIARELDIVPTGDRRRSQSWIDALAGVKLPLLKLLETSPGVDCVQESIELTSENILGVDRVPGTAYRNGQNFPRCQN